MSKIHVLLRTAYETAYDLPVKKRYSEPKIEDFGGDLKKRWYVYFSFRNPQSGKLERQTPIYTGLHQHKTLSDRRRAAEVLRKSLSSILANNLYDPFADDANIVDVARKLTVSEAVQFVLDYKEHIYAGGFIDFKSRIKLFEKWLLSNGFENRYITSVNKIAVQNYLGHVLKKNSPANSNNARSALHNFFECLMDNEYVESNPVARIKPIKNVKPQRHRSFSSKQVNDIFAHLQAINEPQLSLYIKFISYNFLRNIEVSRLEVGNINLNDKTVSVLTKDGRYTTKRIPEILLKELPDLSRADSNAVLFGENSFAEHWATQPVNRRGQYGKMFRKKVKKHFGFGPEYTIYSFRHTFVARLFTGLLEKYSLDEAEGHTMQITGHATRKALRKYLREIDANLPADYSAFLEKSV